MYTNIEFLDTEPIENVITCMHHKMDKVVFFGYQETIEECQKRTVDFLQRHCGVSDVVFRTIQRMDLDEVVSKIEAEVKAEEDKGNHVFFDITGGESLFLVAFGVLADKMSKPMHMYDIEGDRLIHLGTHYDDNVEIVPKNRVELNLPTYIELSGAKIDETKGGCIDVNDSTFMGKMDALWDIVMDFKYDWNTFTGVLRDQLSVERSLEATKNVQRKDGLSLSRFHAFMIRLKNLGAISFYRSRIVNRNEQNEILEVEVTVKYVDFAWKECLTKSGTALELHVYKKLKEEGKEVRQSVHIDWDGVIDSRVPLQEDDVLNEIDVLALEGNIPIFISCKAGKMNRGKALQPLYELETVATRFGGKYAKKVLATVYSLQGVYAERAKEMGITLDVAKRNE